MMSYFLAPDGNNEPSIWRNEPDHPDYPTQILRQSDLPPSARHLWLTFVSAVVEDAA
jgi:hypothetical protein